MGEQIYLDDAADKKTNFLKYFAPTDQKVDYEKLEFLFENENDSKEWPIGQRLTIGAGTAYLTGVASGTIVGLYEGAKDPHGFGSFGLRKNAILNSITKRGSLSANSFGAIYVLYSLFHYGLSYLYEDDRVLPLVSATAAGALFKSTAGIASMARTGALCGATAGIASIFNHFYKEQIYNSH